MITYRMRSGAMSEAGRRAIRAARRCEAKRWRRGRLETLPRLTPDERQRVHRLAQLLIAGRVMG